MYIIKWFRFILLLLACLFFWGGCLPKPYFPGKDLGTLRLRIQRADTPTAEGEFYVMASSISIDRLVVKLTNNQTTVEKTLQPFREGQVITIGSLYPGTWKIQVYAYSTNTWILYGEKEQPILPGETAEASMTIGTAPGWVEVSMDVAPLQALEVDVAKGRFYVYEEPDSDATTEFELTLEGNHLKNRAEILLKEGTYNAFISIPNKSNPSYKSHDQLIEIHSGEVLKIEITADADLIVEGVIDANPPTPDNFEVIPIGEQIMLRWDPVEVRDLAGYNIYRTNRTGRFKLYKQMPKDVLSYHEQAPKANDYFNNRFGYAISSFDVGGNNSIWAYEYLYLDK